MNRRLVSQIGLRVFIPVALLTLGILACLSWLLFQQVDQSRKKAVNAYATVVNQLVKSHIWDGMKARDRQRVQTQLVRIGKLGPIQQVEILNKKGVVVFSSEPTQVGKKLLRKDAVCVACHRTANSKATLSGSLKMQGPGEKKLVKAVDTIVVKPECRSCHKQATGSALGVVVTQFEEANLTGNLELGANRVLMTTVFLSSLLLILLALVLRRTVAGRIRNLQKLVHHLRHGGEDLGVTQESGDELDALARQLQAFALDLDEKSTAAYHYRLFAAALERHAQPLVVFDRAGHIIALSRAARHCLSPDSAEGIVGQPRKSFAGYSDRMTTAAFDKGVGRDTTDNDAPTLFSLSDAEGRAIALLEVWPENPDLKTKGEIPPAPSSQCMTASALLLDRLDASKNEWNQRDGANGLQDIARAVLADLSSVAELVSLRNDVRLSELMRISVVDSPLMGAGIRWQFGLDEKIAIPASRYQLRILAQRLTSAAAQQAGEGGDVIVFTTLNAKRDKAFFGAWANRPGAAAPIDPEGLPAIAQTIADAHSGTIEVDPEFDATNLASQFELRLKRGKVGSLYITQLPATRSEGAA
jgi:HAMP domain-containing protein